MRDWAENQIEAVLIRHGETRANRERRYLGKTDEPLSEEGRRALLEKKKEGRYPQIGILFASPMKRCIQTAELLYPDLEPVAIPEWEEMDFGRFELKSCRDLKDDAYYQSWIDSGGMLPFPGGEDREAFIRRCMAGFGRMCGILGQKQKAKEAHPAFRVGMVVHGGTMMALLHRHCGGAYFDYQAANGNGYRCRMERTGDTVILAEPQILFAGCSIRG